MVPLQMCVPSHSTAKVGYRTDHRTADSLNKGSVEPPSVFRYSFDHHDFHGAQVACTDEYVERCSKRTFPVVTFDALDSDGRWCALGTHEMNANDVVEELAPRYRHIGRSHTMRVTSRVTMVAQIEPTTMDPPAQNASALLRLSSGPRNRSAKKQPVPNVQIPASQDPESS